MKTKLTQFFTAVITASLIAGTSLVFTGGQASASDDYGMELLDYSVIVDDDSDMVLESAEISVEAVDAALSEEQIDFFEAVAGVEHAILMANEVRLGRQHQLRIADESVNAHSNDAFYVLNVHIMAESRELLSNVLEALPEAEAKLDMIVESDADYSVRTQELLELRDWLVSVYEPDGPYENLNNFPASWLSVLPNGDPRNLPINISMGEFYNWSMFIGPGSSMLIWSEQPDRWSSNRGNTSPYSVGHYGVDVLGFLCVGPTSGRVFDADTLTSKRIIIPGHCMNDLAIESRFSYWNDDVNGFQQSWAAAVVDVNLGAGLNHGRFGSRRISDRGFSRPDTMLGQRVNAEFFPFYCQQVNVVTDGRFNFGNNIDLERDVNGNFVHRWMDQCNDPIERPYWEALRPLTTNGQSRVKWIIEDAFDTDFVQNWTTRPGAWPHSKVHQYFDWKEMFPQFTASYVMANIESCDAAGLQVRPGGCWEYLSSDATRG